MLPNFQNLPATEFLLAKPSHSTVNVPPSALVLDHIPRMAIIDHEAYDVPDRDFLRLTENVKRRGNRRAIPLSALENVFCIRVSCCCIACLSAVFIDCSDFLLACPFGSELLCKLFVECCIRGKQFRDVRVHDKPIPVVMHLDAHMVVHYPIRQVRTPFHRRFPHQRYIPVLVQLPH